MGSSAQTGNERATAVRDHRWTRGRTIPAFLIGGGLFTHAIAQSIPPQEPAPVVCTKGVAQEESGKFTPYSAGLRLPDGRHLMPAQQGLFLVSVENNRLKYVPVEQASTGAAHRLFDMRGSGWLLSAEKGLFRVSRENGHIAVHPLKGGQGKQVFAAIDLPGLGWIGAGNQELVLISGQAADLQAQTIHSLPAGSHQLLNADGRAIFVVTQTGFHEASLTALELVAGSLIARSTMALERWSIAAKVQGHWAPEHGLVLGPLRSKQGPEWKIFRLKDGQFKEQSSLPRVMAVLGKQPDDSTVLIGSKGLVSVSSSSGANLVIRQEPWPSDVGSVSAAFVRPGSNGLIGSEMGLFEIPANGRGPLLTRGGGNVDRFVEIRNLGVLAVSENGQLIGIPQPGGGWTFSKFAAAELPDWETRHLQSVEVVDKLGYLAVSLGQATLLHTQRIEESRVSVRDIKNYEGSVIDEARPLTLQFALDHPCADTLRREDMQVEISSPAGKSKEQVRTIDPVDGMATLSIMTKVDKPGAWTFQLQRFDGTKHVNLGEPQRLNFVASNNAFEVWKKRGEVASVLVLAFLLVANAGLLFFSRRSAWAWRMVTSDSLGSLPFRLTTILLSFAPPVQVWVLDLYFKRMKDARAGKSTAFLPLPVTGANGVKVDVSDLVAPPWRRPAARRLWVQANTGMGKTALVKHLMARHFGDYADATAAHRAWGSILIPVAARHFVDGKPDEPNAAWVVHAVRSTLSQAGLPFEDEGLLRRMLKSGTVGVVIDGLHEAGKNAAVEQFLRDFAEAPVTVTSQGSHSEGFEGWSLPATMKDHAQDLLALKLGSESGAQVAAVMRATGLDAAIRSGYDVNLIGDLARRDPTNAALPVDRPALYEAALCAGWPSVEEHRLPEQMQQLSAIAWTLVATRKPHQDTRRIDAAEFCASELLNAIAEAPDKESRPVRLIRRVSSSFEFVHDQMHAYLAARWLARSGFGLDEIEKQIESSTVWLRTREECRTLWNFVALLLSDDDLIALWKQVDDREEWDILRRELKAEASDRRFVDLGSDGG